MAAELEYTSGNHTQVDCIHREIVIHARRFDDTLTSYAAHICSLASRGDDIGAIRVGLEVLRALGHLFPRRASILFKTMKEYSATLNLLRRISDEGHFGSTESHRP